MRPPRGDVVQRLGDRLGRVRRHLDDDVGAAAVGQLVHARARVLAARRRSRGRRRARARARASRASRVRPVTMIVSAPAARAAMTLARPRWPGPRISTRVARAGARHLDRPAKAGAERVEHHRDARRDVGAHRGARSSTGRGTCSRRTRPTGPAGAIERHVAVAEHAAAAAAHLVAARRGRRGSGRRGSSASTATRSPTSTPQRLRGAVADRAR